MWLALLFEAMLKVRCNFHLMLVIREWVLQFDYVTIKSKKINCACSKMYCKTDTVYSNVIRQNH